MMDEITCDNPDLSRKDVLWPQLDDLGISAAKVRARILELLPHALESVLEMEGMSHEIIDNEDGTYTHCFTMIGKPEP